MEKHFFVSDCDGALHDTREPQWERYPLRPNYSFHHAAIDTVADLKATLRAGPYAWPGGYPLYFITDDGQALSFKSAREEFRAVAWAIANNVNNGWRIVACGINYGDGELRCAHSGKRIEAAYC